MRPARWPSSVERQSRLWKYWMESTSRGLTGYVPRRFAGTALAGGRRGCEVYIINRRRGGRVRKQFWLEPGRIAAVGGMHCVKQVRRQA